MALSTTVIVLRVDCITGDFCRVERWCLGDMGGVGYCVEFSRKKLILLLDSMLTLWYTRASLYIYGPYMGGVYTPPPFRRQKKMKKTQIPPCVSARPMVDYAALRPPQTQRSNFENHKPQGKMTGCADCVMMQADTTLPPATYGLEGGKGNPLDGCYRQPWWGMNTS